MINLTVGSGHIRRSGILPYHLGLLVATRPASSKPISRDETAQLFKGWIMSVRIMSQVWEIPTVKGTEKLVLLALADNANDEGIAWPSIGTIARKCGVSRRYAIEILNNLETLGLIEVQHRRIDELKNQTNIYRVVIPASLGVVNQGSLGSEAGFTRGSEAGFTRVVNQGSPKPSFNHQLRTVKEPPQEPENSSLPLSGGIFALYEQTIGLIPPVLVDELKQAELDYPVDWIEDAFKETARQGKHNWKYTKAILQSWQDNGHKRTGTKAENTPPIDPRSLASEVFG